MRTLKQSLSVDGQSLSNNDPDMVIKLDDHEVVQIGSIQDDSITYKFLTRVAEITTYALNLTFTYKEEHKLVIPLTFTHNPTAPNLITTDVPITVSMWERGNITPFTLMFNGGDVTNQITSIQIADNKYVKPDSVNSGDDKQIWEVLYSKEQPFDELVSFAYSFVEGGKTWSYTSEGTFKLPSWNGQAIRVKPFTENDPLFTDIDLSLGGKIDTSLLVTFKNSDYSESGNVIRKPDYDELGNGSITVADGAGSPDTGIPISITASKIGKFVPRVTYAMVNPLGGYPADTDDLTVAFWEPNVVISDKLIATSIGTTTLLPNSVNTLTFKVAQSDGVLVAGTGTFTRGFVIKQDPEGVLVTPGDWFPGEEAGTYTFDVTTGGIAGSFTLELEYEINGVLCKTNPLTYKVPAPYKLTVTQESTEDLLPFVRASLYFTLVDGDGNPVANAVSTNLNLVTNPRNGSVVPSYSSKMNPDPDVPGRYFIGVTPGETTGSITVTMTVAVPGKTDSYVLTNMVWNNVGTPVVATPTPDKAAPLLNEITNVDFTLTKGNSSDPNAPALGTVRITNITGPGSLGRQATATETPGTYNFGIKSAGDLGKVTVNGIFDNDSTASIFPDVPFSFSFEYVDGEVNVQ